MFILWSRFFLCRRENARRTKTNLERELMKFRIGEKVKITKKCPVIEWRNQIGKVVSYKQFAPEVYGIEIDGKDIYLLHSVYLEKIEFWSVS